MSGSLQKISRFVVLMLENRSFDHLVGYMKKKNPAIGGITGEEFSNYQDPNSQTTPVKIGRAVSYTMPFDPGHEFVDVQIQLYGPATGPTRAANPPKNPAAMSGFVSSALNAAEHPDDSALVMKCFEPDQVSVLASLTMEFALFNCWHSSLPGPTWPNRFFVHAATSGGFTDSPSTEQAIAGFEFKNGTIYQRLKGAGKDWRIYHGGLPQAAGINSLRGEYIDPFTKHFREMKFFADDVNSGALPAYTFIEPHYDTGHNFQNGNSMHPLGDVRKGEALIKDVYESLRNSRYWSDTMFIITFDEHGAFYDHMSPPEATPTGDDTHYANKTEPFSFDRLGVRVPTIVVSAYTQKGTVIGQIAEPYGPVFDHSSILATVEKRFGLAALTKRDAAANTLDVAINLDSPRLTADDAPTTLPSPITDSMWTAIRTFFTRKPASAHPDAPLTKSQEAKLGLALGCDLQAEKDISKHDALRARRRSIRRQRDAAQYIEEVEQRIHSSRRRPIVSS